VWFEQPPSGLGEFAVALDEVPGQQHHILDGDAEPSPPRRELSREGERNLAVGGRIAQKTRWPFVRETREDRVAALRSRNA
jgi:hypothetical protein